MPRLLYPLLLLLLCSSCVIAINENGYRELSTAKRQQLRQYPSPYVPTDTPATLVEITGDDIKTELSRNDYTWIHMWKPYCKGPHCMPLYYYDKIATDFKPRQVKSFTISRLYADPTLWSELANGSRHDNVYVLKDAVYGHKAGKGWKKFLCEIINEDNICRAQPTHTIFKKDKLIYHGSDISAAIMDSVLRSN